jgi:flavin reductase (DIM6/NTAB) family NADH-FMN oxidoreductase RutF
MIDACPVSLECRVRNECSIEHRHIFIGSVVQAYVDERHLGADGRVSPVPDLDPILYALDNRYYAVGKAIGTGFRESDPPEE